MFLQNRKILKDMWGQTGPEFGEVQQIQQTRLNGRGIPHDEGVARLNTQSGLRLQIQEGPS